MKTKILVLGFLSVAGLLLDSAEASAWWRRRCFYESVIVCRPYNAFTPLCHGSMTCDGCCPAPCCAPSCLPSSQPWCCPPAAPCYNPCMAGGPMVPHGMMPPHGMMAPHGPMPPGGPGLLPGPSLPGHTPPPPLVPGMTMNPYYTNINQAAYQPGYYPGYYPMPGYYPGYYPMGYAPTWPMAPAYNPYLGYGSMR